MKFIFKFSVEAQRRLCERRAQTLEHRLQNTVFLFLGYLYKGCQCQWSLAIINCLMWPHSFQRCVLNLHLGHGDCCQGHIRICEDYMTVMILVFQSVWIDLIIDWKLVVSVVTVHQTLLQSDLDWQVQWACRRGDRHFALVHHGVHICNRRPLWSAVSLLHHQTAGKVRSPLKLCQRRRPSLIKVLMLLAKVCQYWHAFTVDHVMQVLKCAVIVTNKVKMSAQSVTHKSCYQCHHTFGLWSGP